MNLFTKRSRNAITSKRCLIVVAIWAFSATLSLSPVCARETIQNGSFEFDGFASGNPVRTGWDDAAGIGNDIGFAVDQYAVVADGEVQAFGGYELPPGARDPNFTGVIRPNGAGLFFGQRWGWWNGDGRSGSTTQVVDLLGDSGKPFEFSAWLASRGARDDFDHATITLEFFDRHNASGSSLGILIFDGNDQSAPNIVGSLNIEGFADPTILATQDNWTLYRAEGTIPPDASSASVMIRGQVPQGVPGFGNASYVDLVSLQVIPEPASLVLLLTGLAVALLLWRRSRAKEII